MDTETIESRIYSIRGQKVMLDSELAGLYGVPTKYLNRQVRRNRQRFPKDFMFQLTSSETQDLRLQIATSSWGGRRFLPNVFTEHGVAMLSSVLNIEIVRAFIRLRRALVANPDLATRMRQVEERLSGHDAALSGHGQAIREIFADIRRLMEPVPARRQRRGKKPRTRPKLLQVVATVRS